MSTRTVSAAAPGRQSPCMSRCVARETILGHCTPVQLRERIDHTDECETCMALWTDVMAEIVPPRVEVPA